MLVNSFYHLPFDLLSETGPDFIVIVKKTFRYSNVFFYNRTPVMPRFLNSK